MSRHTSELTDAQWAHIHIQMYQTFVNLACLMIVLRQL